MSSRRYAIDGVFVGRSLTGVTRYAWEIIDELDKLIEDSDIQIDFVIPEGVTIDRAYKNIRVVNYGKNVKFFWLNVSFMNYLLKTKAIGIHLGVNVPWLKPGIVCVYDVNSIANPQYFSKYHVLKTTLEKKLAVKRGKVFTISDFSAAEIEKYVGGKKEDFIVVPCGWQHLEQVQVEGTAKEKYGLDIGSYYFSMSSIAPTKNFKWVLEAAKQNQDQKFVIAGGVDPKSFGVDGLGDTARNVEYLGRVSDEDAKMLMRDCKAFLFPSYYEGFGIPPMEAFACGAPKVVVSDIPVMHEVCGDAACYVDPFNYSVIDIDKITDVETEKPSTVLEKYSWRQSAEILLSVLKNEV